MKDGKIFGKASNVFKRFMALFVILILSVTISDAANYKFQNTLGTILMFINSTSGNVGIGTNSPGTKLEVNGSINISGNGARLYFPDGTSMTTATIGGASSAAGWTNTTTMTSTDLNVNITNGNLTIANGNVGIGTINPSGKLHVSGGNTHLDGERIYVGGASNNGVINMKFSGRINIDSGNNYTDESFIIGNNQETIDQNNVLFKVQENGNVGIGTISPSQKLHVEGNINVSGDGGINIDIVSGSVGTRLRSNGADTGIVGTYTNHPFQIMTNAGAVMHVTTSGSVGIGTLNPESKLTITNITASDLPLIVKGGEADLSPLPQYTGIGLGYGNAMGYVKGGVIFEFVDVQGRGKLHFATDNNADNSNVNLVDAKMTIDNTGKVGIGTTSPTEKLEVNGSIKVIGSVQNISFGNGGYVYDNGSALIFGYN